MRALLLFLGAILVATGVRAEGTVYRGESTLWQDTVWQGEVLVDGILTVAPGATLEIRPGTVVRFTPYDSNRDGIGEHEIFIQGRLRAIGTVSDPIRFTSTSTPYPGGWGAINLMASEEGNRLEHVEISGAYRGFHAHFAKAVLRDCRISHSVRAIQFQESQVELERCRLFENQNGLQFRDAEVKIADLHVSGGYWGVRGVQSRVDWSDGAVAGNLVNGINLRGCDATLRRIEVNGNRKGLYLQQSRVTIDAAQVVDNGEHGIFLEESEVFLTGSLIDGNGRAGIKWVSSHGSVHGSRIVGNGEYAVVNDGPTPADLRGNWWGTVDPATISLKIRDAADLPSVGRVDASEFLTEIP